VSISKKVPKKIRGILAETQEALHRIYQNRLKELILFGSQARGEQSQYSDIDLILLLEDIENASYERENYLPVISDISLKYDTVVSIIPFDVREFHTKRTPLILNVQKEGIRL
jgi:predicted nucleotidyltransferase